MKVASILLLMLALPMSTANRKSQKGRASYGFMGMPSGAEVEGKTDFRDILKPATRLPSYLFDKTKTKRGGPTRLGQVELVQPTDEELRDLGKDIQMTATQARMGDLADEEEDDEADEQEQEAEQGAAARVEPSKAIQTEEFSSPEEEPESEKVLPPQRGTTLFSETDAMLVRPGQVQEQRESGSESEAETPTSFSPGSSGLGLGGGEKFVMYEKPKALSPLEKPQGPGRRGRRNRGRRQPPQSQSQQPPPQRTGKAGKGKKFLFKGDLGEFFKWNDEQKKKRQ